MAASPENIRIGVRILAELPWAWECTCGAINKGLYQAGATCGSCRFESRPEHTKHYLLVEPSDGPS